MFACIHLCMYVLTSAQLPEIIGASMKAGLGGFNAVIDLVNNPVTIGRSIHVISKVGVLRPQQIKSGWAASARDIIGFKHN